jgi:CHAD domain-containing protein
MSSGRVRFWLRNFRAVRMDIFGSEAPSGVAVVTAPPIPQPAVAAAVVEPPPVKGVARRRSLPTVRQFCRDNQVDMAHARHVSALVAELFDELQSGHRLPRKHRRLLRQAALLYSLGTAQDAEHSYRAGRDLILAQPLRGVSTSDRLALAALVALNRNRVRPDREPAMEALDARTREHIPAMTALLHVAEALDFSRTQSTQVVGVEGHGGGRLEVTVSGPAAAVDALQAGSRAALWYELFGQELVFAHEGGQEMVVQPTIPAAPANDVAAAPAEPEPAAQPISAAEPMSEAGRKILGLHFGRMLANEVGTRLGEDIEALHDMRVATRRMRAALQIFEPYYDADATRPLVKGLRRTGRMLGAVRDLDVLLEKAHAFQETLPESVRESFTPLITHWQTARDMARRRMLEYLDGKSYREFTTYSVAFVSTPGEGAIEPGPGQPLPYLVRHVAPQLIFERYEAVRSYDAVLPDAPLPIYHLLRIDCKRLRYALEFFKEVLGSETSGIIKQVTAMQDLLGELQDAHVAEGLIQAFLDEQQKRKKKKEPAPWLEGVHDYLTFQHARQEELLTGFGPGWADLTGLAFRRALGLAVATP